MVIRCSTMWVWTAAVRSVFFVLRRAVYLGDMLGQFSVS
jgi:hypothetical protein